jgi:hypothetical protein
LRSRTLRQRQGCQCRGLWVPSAPPVQDDHNDVFAPPKLTPAYALSAPPAVHHSFVLSISAEFIDQFNPKPATPAPAGHSLIRICALRDFTMELLQDPVVAADGWIHAPCPPLLVSPLHSWPSATPPVPKAGRCCPALRWCQIMT